MSPALLHGPAPSALPAQGDTAAEVALDLLQVAGFAAGGLLIGLVASIILSIIAAALRRHDPVWTPFSKRLRLPQRILMMVLGAGLGILFATQTSVVGSEVLWRPVAIQLFTIALILSGAFMLTSLMFAIEDAVLMKFESTEETGHARRVRTQIQMIRRIMIALIWISAVVGVLMTFPAFRGIGATFFASAGLASIVAGLAAQSTLGNIFAGVQIAFTDSVRVGDVVVVEGEHGSIEELTLTYVVVRIWDNRRLILPSTYFTTKPFQNWTRRESHLLGVVMLEVDWFTPIPAMRIELQRIVRSTDLWDGRTSSLQVVDAVNGKLSLRAAVSASNPGRLWDLRTLVREQLVEWMQKTAAYSVPRTRIEPETTTAPPLEAREEFIDDVEREWAETHPAEEPEQDARPVAATADEPDDSVFGWTFGREDPVKRARREAERADKRASRKNPTRLAGHERVLPLPSHDETRILSLEDLAALDATHGISAPSAGSASIPDDASAPSAASPTSARGARREEGDPERTSIRRRRAPVQHDDAGPPTAESRLYSGSPDAEERARFMEGPAREDIAEREELAKRRQEKEEHES
ncbi:MAG: mechanosensitive ion channel [bacterium]|nr:mechanosensitive ion channel [bacterium]